jgi:Domain of unknown function (DUF4157)
VRVHTDGRADGLNRSIQAKAFTTGQNIFFRQGAYQPGSKGGQELIAHELTHVVQQDNNVVQNVIQCSGIQFKNKYGREIGNEISVNDLQTWQLELILLDPNDIRIKYVGDKLKLLDSIKKRLNAIQEAKLKRASDGGLGYVSGTDRYVVAQYPKPDTPTRQQLEEEYDQLSDYTIVDPRTPLNYGQYPPGVVHTPGGTEANRSGAYGSTSPGGTFTGTAFWSATYPNVQPPHISNAPVPLAKTPIPCTATTKDSGWQIIDKARLKGWVGQRKGYQPSKSMAAGEATGQNGAMGNISAKEAAANSGYTTGAWEWLHLIAFTLGGINQTKVNHHDNLVAGTVQANRQHKVLEDTVKKLLIDNITDQVAIRAIAQLQKGSYHLAEELEYALSFKIGLNGDVKTYTNVINCLSPNPAQGGNMAILVQTLIGLGKS